MEQEKENTQIFNRNLKNIEFNESNKSSLMISNTELNQII